MRPGLNISTALRLCASAILAALPLAAEAQAPRITTLFPIGGRAGSTVEVEVRGAGLSGADSMVVSGQGVSGAVEAGSAKADERNKPIWQSKCGSCHELRSPANRSMTAAQWAATVDRMVKQHQAPLSADEAAKVTEYLQSAARAGHLTATLTIAPGTAPGIHEVRVATPRGLSTAGLFEVGALPEILGVNGTPQTAQTVTLPCVANGTLAANAERHCYRFRATKGQRIVFNLKGFRYNEASQMFFNPVLHVYDASGADVAENHGFHELDPLIDWTCPADGDYVVEVRDLLGRGNPASVYRLTMGPVPYDTVLYPPAVQSGVQTVATLEGKDLASAVSCPISAPREPGMTTVSTPAGPEPVYVSPYPVITKEQGASAVTRLPAGFAGRILQPGQADSFYVAGAGAVDFDVMAAQLGSTADPRIQLLNAKGGVVARSRRDGRITADLDPKETYTLRVDDPSGEAGTDHIYFVEAHPAAAVLECVARPASIALHPGTVTPVMVRIARRERIDGDVTVTADDLPEGVTATPAVIQPDREEAWLLLSAAADAKPAARPIRIVATAHGVGGELRTAATPQETYLINNQPYYVNRTACLAAVCGAPEISPKVENPGPITVELRKGVQVKVRIDRINSYKGAVILRIEGLPSGWVASPEYVGPDRTEATLLVRPDGNNTRPFLTRDPKLTPIEAVIVAEADEIPYVAGTAAVMRPDKIVQDNDRQ